MPETQTSPHPHFQGSQTSIIAGYRKRGIHLSDRIVRRKIPILGTTSYSSIAHNLVMRSIAAMEQVNPANESLGRWIMMEHYRLHSVEAWPHSRQKEAVLKGIHSALHGLEASLAPLQPPQCIICASRRVPPRVLEFPSRSQGSPSVTRLAA
jgi:hypothetical protein